MNQDFADVFSREASRDWLWTSSETARVNQVRATRSANRC